MTLKQARKRKENFEPKDSNCPICGKEFRTGCNHSVLQAYMRLDEDIIRATVQSELYIKGLRNEKPKN